MAVTTGQKLTLLSIGLLAVGMLPMQLTSPVAPFMDVLAIPAAAQRIITFHRYLPTDNNPYGLWSNWAGMPGLELFLAFLAWGARLQGFGAGVLAQSQLMFAITAFMLLAVWKLGSVLFNDVAGGIASLLVWWTCLIRRSQGVRGNTAVFALGALGLAFWLEHRYWLGGMLLLTSVVVYSMIGAMFCGLAVCVALPNKYRGPAIVMMALLPWFFVGWIDQIAHTPRFYPQTLAWDIRFKLDQYWLPFWLVFPGAALISLAWSRLMGIILVYALLTLPLHYNPLPWPDYTDARPHSILEQWTWQWYWARHGYWDGAHDRRWLFDAKDFKLFAPLQDDIDAGRITTDTHLLHITDSDSSWTLTPISVFTGIDEDVADSSYDRNNLFEQGSRVRGLPVDRTKYRFIFDQRTNVLTR